MRIEMKNVKIAASLSEETLAFTASIYVDGKRVGDASNHGTGGMTMVWIGWREVARDGDLEARWGSKYTRTVLREAMEAFAATHTWSFEGEDIPYTLDSYIDHLVYEWDAMQQRKRLCRGKTLAQLPNQTYTEGEWSVFKIKFTPVIAKALRGKYGDSVKILNESIA
jgi:hypothetical protein